MLMSWFCSRFIHQRCLRSHNTLVSEEMGRVVSNPAVQDLQLPFNKPLKLSSVGRRSMKSLPLGIYYFSKDEPLLKDECNL